MFSKNLAVAKASALKSSIDAVHTAVDALPNGPEKAAVEAAVNTHHGLLYGLAHRAARFFGGGVTTFSGGGPKPANVTAPEEDVGTEDDEA